MFVCTAVVLCYCKPKSIQADQLSSYVEEKENGLAKEIIVAETSLKLTFKPAVQLALQELKGNSACDSLLPEFTKKYTGYKHFVMTYSADGKDPVYKGSHSQQTFSERLQKLAFHVGDYVYAVSGTDTIPLADSYFLNQYGMGGAAQVLLVFSAQKSKESDIKVCVKDMGFGLGFQYFDFKEKDLDNIPELHCD